MLLGKIQSKIRSSPECLQSILKLLQTEDEKSLINSSECLSILAEDAGNRADFIKNNAVGALLVALEKPSLSVQSVACLALARCLQDGKKIFVYILKK